MRPQRSPSRQRSFRLSARSLELLDDRARRRGESANSLAQRLLDEALRTDEHPLIFFRHGAGGGRRPALVATRLDVWQVIATLRAEGGDVAATAGYFGIDETRVRACISYYADFTDEVEADAAAEDRAERQEHERWQREQTVLG